MPNTSMQFISDISEVSWLFSTGCLDNPGFMNSIMTDFALGKIKIGYNLLDRADSLWNGELFIRFRAVPKAIDIVNGYIGLSSADEIHMIDSKTLRLWWD